MSRHIPDVTTAWRCIRACANYLERCDDSPKAALDLIESATLLEAREAALRARLEQLEAGWREDAKRPIDGARGYISAMDGASAETKLECADELRAVLAEEK